MRAALLALGFTVGEFLTAYDSNLRDALEWEDEFGDDAEGAEK